MFNYGYILLVTLGVTENTFPCLLQVVLVLVEVVVLVEVDVMAVVVEVEVEVEVVEDVVAVEVSAGRHRADGLYITSLLLLLR